MRIEINVYKSKHSWNIVCCNKESTKTTKSKTGRCWVDLWFKCSKCGSSGKFRHWFYEGYNPTAEEKKEGAERELQRNQYIIDFKPQKRRTK